MLYSDLTPEQKDKICNGCGVKGLFIKVPDFLFKASCDHHDYLYYCGYSEADRKKADDSFYKFMRVDIKNAKIYLKPFYHIWAFFYYLAVRTFGKKYFYYANSYKED